MSSSGVTVVGSDSPSEYHVAVRTETPVTGSVPHMTPHVGVSPAPAPAPAMVVSPVSVDLTGIKKKRGRPRKYGPDGSVTKALSPKPISSSAPPPVIDFSVEKPRGKVRPVGLPAKQHQPKMQMEGLGKLNFCFFLKIIILLSFDFYFCMHVDVFNFYCCGDVEYLV